MRSMPESDSVRIRRLLRVAVGAPGVFEGAAPAV